MTRGRHACNLVEVNRTLAQRLTAPNGAEFVKMAVARSIVAAARQDKPKALAEDFAPSQTDHTPMTSYPDADEWIWSQFFDAREGDSTHKSAAGA